MECNLFLHYYDNRGKLGEKYRLRYHVDCNCFIYQRETGSRMRCNTGGTDYAINIDLFYPILDHSAWLNWWRAI